MRKISDKDKRLWDFYVSNLKSIKKTKKQVSSYNRVINSNNVSSVPKILKPNVSFLLDSKTKKQLKKGKFVIDDIIDLHGKSETQANELIKNFIKKSYFNAFKSIIIITGKGTNNQGKLKLKTPLWLKGKELSKFIIGFENMPSNKGGDGALFVKLKSKNKYNN